jgi:quinol monooxygenase YgiN
MERLASFVRLDTRVGKEQELEALLRSAIPLVATETGTRSWFALQMAPQMYGIFGTFDNESDREAHLSGRVAQALVDRASELLARPPVIEKVQILAAHEPQAQHQASMSAPPSASAPPKDRGPPQSGVSRTPSEVPKVGSRDAPGG